MTVAGTVPKQLDLEVYAGDENRLEIQILINGQPLDITDAILSAQCRKTPNDQVVAMTAKFEDIDRTIGIVAMLWNGDEVRDVLAGNHIWNGVWDFQIEMPGKIRPTSKAKGRFTMLMDVTR